MGFPKGKRKYDECKEAIVNAVFKLIEAEPDLAAYSFGLSKQGSHIYITVKDEETLRTFNIWIKEEYTKPMLEGRTNKRKTAPEGTALKGDSNE